MKKTITLRHGRKILNPEYDHKKAKRQHISLLVLYVLIAVLVAIVTVQMLNAIDRQVCGSADPQAYQAMYCEEVN